MTRVIYIPLDERHCNLILPGQIGATAGLEVITPGADIIGQYKMRGNADVVWSWLIDNAPRCKYAVISLDMLVYGGLVRSRKHSMTTEECSERLKRIKRLRESNPDLVIIAYMLIMRTSNMNNNSEDPDYWLDYGKKMWSLSYLSDKKSRTFLHDLEEKQLKSLEKAIPQEHIDDYTGRRKNNLEINLQALEMLKNGYIDELVIPKDDNSEYGYSTKDNEAILAEVSRLGIAHKVMIYPGTDEVGSVLMARILNRVNDKKPRVFVCYSSTLGPQIIAKYEDRPINESVKCQIISSGCITVDSSVDADIILMVNSPGTEMIEAAEQSSSDQTYSNYRNLREFIERLKFYIDHGSRCIIADIAYCNGADNELMDLLVSENLLDKIHGYGGWNTTSNTLGVVISQGVASCNLGLMSIRSNNELYKIHMYKTIEDWAFQANVLKNIVTDLAKNKKIDNYNLDEHIGSISERISTEVNEFIGNELTTLGSIKVGDVRLPWGRTFDIDYDLIIG
ncbi:MAG: DUF4127 family protein [Oscillospiraceae bacterium]|nr:DUF4127 family protein [Oscillospiraceae bacterium]